MPYTPLFHTYSIVARDPDTGELGVAVQTHQMCVGAIVPWLEPGMGALATQASANISFGPIGLAMLREGIDAPHVVEALVASDPGADRRQLAVVDAEGGRRRGRERTASLMPATTSAPATACRPT